MRHIIRVNVVVPYADEIAIYAPEYHISSPGVDRGAHRKGCLDPFNERPFHELLFGEHTGRLHLHWRASQGAVSNRALTQKDIKPNYTHAQKTVEIDAARVECAVEVIYRVLDRIVLGDEVNESVLTCEYV
jgi:hypothetical protein